MFQEEEKKENNNDITKNDTSEKTLKQHITQIPPDSVVKDNLETSKSPVRTRSQNKMESKIDKPKPVKKTVTFGTVESCEDILLPLKKLPSKHQAPLASIIKKKSALKQTEYSFSSILKPAKLTDLSSKSSFENPEGFLRKNLNPLSKPMNKFSQIMESRCMSPPPRNISPHKECGSKFVLPIRSAHSSRVIKPNKRFMDGEESSTTTTSSIISGKLLKKPKLKRLVFNNFAEDDDAFEDDDEDDQPLGPCELKEKPNLGSSSFFKDKLSNTFSNNNGKSRKLFSFDKDNEYYQGDNSNYEGLERIKGMESHKEDRGGHAMRKLMNISDASSSSTTSTESESEDSWESDTPSGSGDDTERPAQSPEREKHVPPPSQLLSGKVIIREARLQLNPPTQTTLGPDGPFSNFAGAGCEYFLLSFHIYVQPVVI